MPTRGPEDIYPVYAAIAGMILADILFNFWRERQQKKDEQFRYDREFAGIVEAYE